MFMKCPGLSWGGRSESIRDCIRLGWDTVKLQQRISCRNYEAIENILSKGIPVIFATARPPRMVKLLLPSSLYDRSFKIFYNGALIIDHRNVMIAHYTIVERMSTLAEKL